MTTVRSPDSAFWRGRRVLLTGHTGFKGSWLALWLASLGAEVHGFALEPTVEPAPFVELNVEKRLASHCIGDVRDARAVAAAVAATRPEVTLHLAAQALVRRSYAEPLLTYATNVMGTAHVLEALRGAGDPGACVVVTSDKVYAERVGSAYAEDDRLGGHDPYSASKAAAELVVASYRASFLATQHLHVATARAGNVIGGGDRSQDRLMVDVVAALLSGDVVALRHPEATRPWQHVLDPLSGYLILAERLVQDGPSFARPWNFGPAASGVATVEEVVTRAREAWGGSLRVARSAALGPHEAPSLILDARQACHKLGWTPRLDLDHAVAWTIEWERERGSGASGNVLALGQIDRYAALDALAAEPV